MMLFLYNILFPFAFIFYVPGMIIKLIKRGGDKRGFGERFAIFAKEKLNSLKEFQSAIWIHAVSVGETTIALAMIEKWTQQDPEAKFVLSTTTTTGQALASGRSTDNTIVIFCPIDFIFFVRKTLRILKPKLLVLFETEIWPNLIRETRAFGTPVALVNGRISDKSANGYRRFSFFFAPILKHLSLLCVQTDLDSERFKAVDATLKPNVCGNMKFDQKPPAKIAEIDLSPFFGSQQKKIILAASTHPNEESFVARVFKELKKSRPELRLVIVPRHAERGAEISSELRALGLSHARRSTGESFDSERKNDEVDVLLADTTGEMLSFISSADVVIMGKSLAGHNEGHNILEPAILAKPVVTGNELRNFRFVLKTMLDADAVKTVSNETELLDALAHLLDDPKSAAELGKRAKSAVEKQKGATQRTIELCKTLLN